MVSIIVAAYNVEDYIEKCLESIVNQTYKDIEIVIVDDGSTDNTYEICKRIKNTDDRVNIYKVDNSGVSAARNYGLSKALGDYILFADSDDYMDYKMVEFLMDAIKDSDVAICRECAFYDGEEDQNDDIKNDDIKNDKYTLDKNETRNELICHFADVFTGPVGWPWNKLYRRELIGENRFLEGKKMEDLFFNCDVLLNVKKATWIKDRLYYYRQRQGSIMNSGDISVLIDYSEALLYQREKFYPILSNEEKSRMASYFIRKTYSLMDKEKKFSKTNKSSIIKDNFKMLYREDLKFVKSIKDRIKIRLYYISSFFC